jgi:heat shock protein beta
MVSSCFQNAEKFHFQHSILLLAEDLPLNVSRETLQSNKFMRQLRQIILKRLIQLFAKTMETEDKDKYEKFSDIYGSVLKLGAVEDTKNREKLATLARFSTNQRNDTSFDMVRYTLFSSIGRILKSELLSVP